MPVLLVRAATLYCRFCRIHYVNPHMNTSIGLKIAKHLGTACVIVFAVGLLFRFAVYRHMYIAPDAPFGVSDLVEYVLAWILILLIGASVLFGLFLAIRGPKANRVGGPGFYLPARSLLGLQHHFTHWQQSGHHEEPAG